MALDLTGQCIPLDQQCESQSATPLPPSSRNSSSMLSSRLPSELLVALLAESKFKDRSERTHEQVHLPCLRVNLPIEVLLLGDSMFERFQTTGRNTVWSSATTSYPKVFNAGVGGDGIRNIAYRLMREQGLLDCVIECGGAEYIFLEVGTNDLGDGKRPLRIQDIQVYRLLIEALRLVCVPRLKALVVCGLNPKRRVKNEVVVKESNALLKDLVRGLQKDLGGDDPSIEYLDADERIIQHLEKDGVHLNEKGYEIFAERLLEKYEELRNRFEVEKQA